MTLEKISDTQIKCTLYSEDLSDRHIKLSELRYGNDKTRELFQEMMQMAAVQLGFEGRDTPLMVEAVPMPGNCIILIITKIVDSEELDPRFSSFSPGVESENPNGHNELFKNLFSRADELISNATESISQTEATTEGKIDIKDPSSVYLWVFENFEDICSAGKILNSWYHGKNTLYYNPSDGLYYLSISQSDHSREDFNKVCNILSEYANSTPVYPGTLGYLEEHAEIISSPHAIHICSKF